MKTQTPLKAIRRKCLDCQRWALVTYENETDLWHEEEDLPKSVIFPSVRAIKRAVKECDNKECALFLYRMGKRLPVDTAL